MRMVRLSSTILLPEMFGSSHRGSLDSKYLHDNVLIDIFQWNPSLNSGLGRWRRISPCLWRWWLQWGQHIPCHWGFPPQSCTCSLDHLTADQLTKFAERGLGQRSWSSYCRFWWHSRWRAIHLRGHTSTEGHRRAERDYILWCCSSIPKLFLPLFWTGASWGCWRLR